jgi:hypothetical protein
MTTPMNNRMSSLVANSESIPEKTSEIRALDQSEKEYNRMISQHTTYHRMMMDDLMKLSSESGSMNANANANAMVEQMTIVAGLGSTVEALDASNQQLMQAAAKYVDQGKQRAITASNLNAYMHQTGLKLQDDMKAYDAAVSNAQKEGFDTMDAALEISEIMSESQKYALFIFGAFAMFLLYKTVKQL